MQGQQGMYMQPGVQPGMQPGMNMHAMQQGMPMKNDMSDMPIAQAPPYIRSAFIRKVYSILTVQLLVTFGLALYMNTQLPVTWAQQNYPILMFASVGTIALMFGVSCCCSHVMRSFPQNYIFLGLITLGISITTGAATMVYTTESVLIALGATAVVFGLLTAYACFAQTDFTGMGPYLMGGLLALMGFGFVLSMFSYFGSGQVDSRVHMLYACCGVVLFVFYIIYDTQMIVGGNHKQHQFGIDDYVFAALNLYLDIINLFLYLLQLFGDRR